MQTQEISRLHARRCLNRWIIKHRIKYTNSSPCGIFSLVSPPECNRDVAELGNPCSQRGAPPKLEKIQQVGASLTDRMGQHAGIADF